jgi:hypothetical protein
MQWNILSNNYTEIRTIYNLNQTAQTSDFHEVRLSSLNFPSLFLTDLLPLPPAEQMILTERNSALVEAWTLAETDLTGTGYNSSDGSSNGWTWDCNLCVPPSLSLSLPVTPPHCHRFSCDTDPPRDLFPLLLDRNDDNDVVAVKRSIFRARRTS